jgi:hypothetical protein
VFTGQTKKRNFHEQDFQVKDADNSMGQGPPTVGDSTPERNMRQKTTNTQDPSSIVFPMGVYAVNGSDIANSVRRPKLLTADEIAKKEQRKDKVWEEQANRFLGTASHRSSEVKGSGIFTGLDQHQDPLGMANMEAKAARAKGRAEGDLFEAQMGVARHRLMNGNAVPYVTGRFDN